MLALPQILDASRTPPAPHPADQSTGPYDLTLPNMLPSLSISSAMHIHSPSLPSPVSRPQRPRLKLDTDLFQPTTYGKGGGSGLRLEALSAVSPTVRNTFSNAICKPSSANCVSSSIPTPTPTTRPARPRLAIDSSVHVKQLASPTSSSPSSTPSSASVVSATSTDSSSSSDSTNFAPVTIPYKLSYSVRSILRNSPLPAVGMSSTIKRPMFPPQKRVSFRCPIDEEIQTTKYIVAHSELELSVDSVSTASNLDASTESTSPSTQQTGIDAASPSSCNRALTRAVSDKSTKPKQSSSSAKTGEKRMSEDECSEGDRCPETPVAGRRKKQREWVWTLGPIDGQKVNSSDEETEESDNDSTRS